MDLAQRLGAGISKPQKFSIYLPDRDANNQPVTDIGSWLDKAVWLMTDINGGCTRLPPARGAWINQDNQSKVIEDTVVIYSHLFKPEIFIERFDEIVVFLHEYGRATNQDAIMAEFSGWANDEDGYINEAYFIPSTTYTASE